MKRKHFGIDVSYAQGQIDWMKVKRENPFLSFAMIKCSQGGDAKSKVPSAPFADPTFRRNMEGASAAGLRIGVYHYLAAVTVFDAVKEAEFVLSLLEEYRERITLPVALDLEDMDGYPKYSALDESYNASLIRAFCDRIKKAGYDVCLYSNLTFLQNVIDRRSLRDIPIWYARWGVSEQIALKEEPSAVLWQYGIKKVDGLGDVDVNILYEEEKTMIRYPRLKDIPNDSGFRDIVETLMNAGIIKGDGSDPDGNGDVIDLSHDQVRSLVFEYRGGAFDRKLKAAGFSPAVGD